ncbi:non-homologous end-joining DNA ligase [Rhodococcus qingshengii]|uniref:DNA ligase (ATP) n=1 Tax=Rhodococcus qingshengii TaxID=334542 RepID=A0AAW6LUJ3_RHOSG|nr:non-homologous end-joining DNA ligase [Rhodococcus qingshengii]MDE8647615.1 non-homologous end-joining DNA ligase [Rhodococcus qingshengii]
MSARKPVKPMLATLGPPPEKVGWAFEQKWDGLRAIAATGEPAPVLWSRNQNVITRSFPEIVDALAAQLGNREVVLDGEIVALDARGVPSFSLLQRRMNVQAPTAQVRRSVPVTYYPFDVLTVDGESTMPLPYLERRAVLEDLGLIGDRIVVPPHWLDIDGAAMLEVARKHHLEGIVAKRVDSTYQPGKRSPRWIKCPIRAKTTAVICGYLPGSGTASGGIGSLVLGAHDDSGSLIQLGHVGTGFTARTRRDLWARLHELERPTSPFAVALPPSVARNVRWVEPLLICDVEYREYVGGALRHPSYKGLRTDKSVDDITAPLLRTDTT